MAFFGPEDVGVHTDDIIRASRQIAESGYKDDVDSHGCFGSALNQWQKPVADFGGPGSQWITKILSRPYIGQIDFGRKDWARARDAVDAVLELLLKEMRAKAVKYTGLRIDSYVRQGSARDGLKVIAPDEFDTVIEFHIEGLRFSRENIYRNGRLVPGYCYLKLQHSQEELKKRRYERLWHEEVFITNTNGELFLSSKMLHEKVFKSIIDMSCDEIVKKIQKQAQQVAFGITRKMNPPAVGLTIHLGDDANNLFMRQGQIRNPTEDLRQIDVDIVPAIRLNVDTETVYNGNRVNAAIHAVCKWKEEEALRCLEFVDQSLVWHINSAGYERYVFDVARTNQKQRYIMTALRLFKTYWVRTKTRNPPPQITAVVKSYHLKQIALYLILYSCYKHPFIDISSLGRAVGCMSTLLGVCLSRRHLPHFFYSNTDINSMFPNYPRQASALRFDLFRKIPIEALNQADISRETMDNDLCLSGGSYDHDLQLLKTDMEREVSTGEYF